MAVTDVERFMENFERVWAAPQPEEFAALWHDDGVLLHPTMDRVIRKDEIPEYIRAIKGIVPDISLKVENWAARGDVVLVEWVISATFGDETITWRGADRFTLRGDRAVEGIAYFDTLPLWTVIDPSMKRGHLLDGYVEQAAAAGS